MRVRALGGVLGLPQGPGHVAGGEPGARQRALRPQQQLRVARQPRAVGGLLARGHRIRHAAELAQGPHRLGADQQQDGFAPARLRGGRGALEGARAPRRSARACRRRRRASTARAGASRAARRRAAPGPPRRRRRPRRSRRRPGRPPRRAAPSPSAEASSTGSPSARVSASASARASAAVGEVARQQRVEPERELQADPVGGRLGREVAEREVEAAAGVLVAAQPVSTLATRTVSARRSGAGARASAARSVSRAAAGSPAALWASASATSSVVRRRGVLRQDPERGGVEARRRGGRRTLQLGCGRGEQVRGRRVTRHGGVLEVVRAGDDPGAAALERCGGPGVGGQPPSRGHRVVDRVADDGMAEGEAPRRAGGAHERPCEELVERLEGGRLGQLGHVRREAGLERIAGHGGGVEQAVRRGRHAGELGGEGERDGGRDRPGRGRVPFAPGGRRGSAAPRELLEVERIAAAHGIESGHVAAHQRSGLVLGERQEREAGDAVLAHRGGEGRRERAGERALAHREREQDRAGGRPACRAPRARRGSRDRPTGRRRGRARAGEWPRRARAGRAGRGGGGGGRAAPGRRAWAARRRAPPGPRARAARRRVPPMPAAAGRARRRAPRRAGRSRARTPSRRRRGSPPPPRAPPARRAGATCRSRARPRRRPRRRSRPAGAPAPRRAPRARPRGRRAGAGPGLHHLAASLADPRGPDR